MKDDEGYQGRVEEVIALYGSLITITLLEYGNLRVEWNVWITAGVYPERKRKGWNDK